MNYSTLCRRLLRSHPGERAVADAVAAFAAAQASQQQQQYHLAALAAELLVPRSLAAAPPAGQCQLLRCMPQLLAALPEAQAAALLGDVCRHACAGAGCSDERAALLLALLLALRQLLAGESGASLTLQQAAQRALTEQLLPALPPPSFYPMDLAALAGEEASEQLLSPQQQCWAAALRCLALLPDAAREQLVSQPALQAQPLHAAFATAALVAAGALSPRALQHPRNLLLGGGGGGATLPPPQQALAALLVGRAVATLAAEEQPRALLEALDACKVCGWLVGWVARREAASSCHCLLQPTCLRC